MPQNIDEKLVKRESVKAFALAVDDWVNLIMTRERIAAASMKRDAAAAHLARVQASAEMRRDAAISLMRDAFEIEG